MGTHSMLAQQLVAALSVGAAFDGGVSRQSARTIPTTFTKAVNVRIVGSDPELDLSGVGAPIGWLTRVAIECIGKTITSDTAPDEAAESTLALAHQKIVAALSTLQAAGFDIVLTPTLRWDQEQQDQNIGAVIAFYDVRHATSSLDLNT